MGVLAHVRLNNNDLIVLRRRWGHIDVVIHNVRRGLELVREGVHRQSKVLRLVLKLELGGILLQILVLVSVLMRIIALDLI